MTRILNISMFFHDKEQTKYSAYIESLNNPVQFHLMNILYIMYKNRDALIQ